MAENPVETGQQLIDRWRAGDAAEPAKAYFQRQKCADEFATFLSRLRELSAEYRRMSELDLPPLKLESRDGTMALAGIEVAAQAVYKKVADSLDARLGERVTGGEKGQ